MEKLITRSMAEFQPKTYREADNSVEFTLATENPSTIFSWEHGYIAETLLSDGVVLPKNRQIPLLNCHNRDGLDNILGSVRDFRIEDNKVIGRLYFANSEQAKRALEMVKEGHIDSGSVGYSQEESVYLPEGENAVIDGRSFKGEMLITKRWNLHEFSLVPVPADSEALVRSKDLDGKRQLVSAKAADTKEIKEEATTMEATENKVNVEDVTRAAANEARTMERERINAINTLCEKHNCREIAEKLIADGSSVEVAQREVLSVIEKRSQSLASAKSNIVVTADEGDKFRAAAVDGLMLRTHLADGKTADGAEDFAKLGFKGLAREVLRRNGVNRIMSDEEALREVCRSGSQSYSDFSHILNQGANKAVLKGYQQAANTWRMWCSVGSLPNLEQVEKANLADMPDLIKNPEGAEIKAVKIGDRGEKIQLVTYAAEVKLTRRALLADDMGFFRDIARKFGLRAAQKIEELAYGVLTTNAALSDSVTLFHASHNNLAGSSAALSKNTLAAAYAAMKKQTDVNGSKLAIFPKYLLVSPDDAVEAEILTSSMTDVSANFTSGNTNFFRNHGIVAIDSPYISNAFFVAADPNAAPTVEISFLNGKETPTIEEIENAGDILGKKWLCYIDIGASALDFRGLYKNPTA